MLWVALHSVCSDVLVIHFTDKTQLGLALYYIADLLHQCRPTPCDPQLLVRNLLHSPVFDSVRGFSVPDYFSCCFSLYFRQLIVSLVVHCLDFALLAVFLHYWNINLGVFETVYFFKWNIYLFMKFTF